MMRFALLILTFMLPSYSFAQEEGAQGVASADALVPQAQPPATPSPSVNAVDALPKEVPSPDATEAQTNVVSLPPQPEDFIPVTEEITPIEQAMLDQIGFLKPSVNIRTMPSLFFSVWEHDLLVDARRGLNTRPPQDDDQVEATVATGPRDIALSGIVYASSNDWVIWLNNMRISPGRIPNEVMDLKVYKNHIDLEWFDASTNQIFPIRLRPHQRFNLDARIFLPGNT